MHNKVILAIHKVENPVARISWLSKMVRVCESPIDFGSYSVLYSVMPSHKRYPSPWRIEEDTESYIVVDDNGQRLAFVYFEDEPVRQSTMKRIGKGDANQLARAISRIPRMIQRD